MSCSCLELSTLDSTTGTKDMLESLALPSVLIGGGEETVPDHFLVAACVALRAQAFRRTLLKEMARATQQPNDFTKLPPLLRVGSHRVTGHQLCMHVRRQRRTTSPTSSSYVIDGDGDG